jgi:hypothetical protein
MRADGLIDAAVNALVSLYLSWTDATLRAPLLRLAQRPAEAQRRTLLEIVRENAETEFGREHGFADVKSLADFRARTPVRDFDGLAPYIRRQAAGAPALTAAPPVYYARTSGTTGRFKDVPLTAAGLRQVKRAQKLLAASLHAGTGFFRGQVLGFASPAVEGVTAAGAPYGSMSGGVYRSITPVVARKLFVPPGAYAVADYDRKYLLYALASVAAPEVTGVATANPSTIQRVLDVVETDGERLVELLEGGPPAGMAEDEAAVVRAIRARVSDRAGRARALRALLAADGRLYAQALWPKLAAVATWTGGSCGIALEELIPRLPRGARIVELGYSASELMAAANVDAVRNVCLPLLDEHVYELVPRAAREAGRDETLGLEEARVGEEYYVVVTTRSGLYRYDINDIVLAEEGVGQCVGLRFLQKGKGVTSVTGEKLSEHQAIAAVRDALRARGVAAAFFLLLADERERRYELLLELTDPAPLDALAADVDARLASSNEEFSAKRASGRLGPVTARLLRDGAGEAIKRAALAAGARESQYKPLVLDYARNWADRLPALCATGVAA